nr:hypothetical protein [Paracoccus saliphilus]
MEHLAEGVRRAAALTVTLVLRGREAEAGDAFSFTRIFWICRKWC